MRRRAIFVAQATDTPPTMVDQLVILGVLMLTSKGSAGVTGAGVITLAATLASMGKIPVAGMVLLLGVDRFMSEARAITNTIGNAVGTMAIAKWVGDLDDKRVKDVLNGNAEELRETPKATLPKFAERTVVQAKAARQSGESSAGECRRAAARGQQSAAEHQRSGIMDKEVAVQSLTDTMAKFTS